MNHATIGFALGLSVAAAALSNTPAVAEHGGPWVHTFPPSESTLPPNGRIVLISMNGEDDAMPDVGAKGLALYSDSDVVPVRVVEARHDPDGYGEAASVLVPKRRLMIGATYKLRWPKSGYEFSWTISRRADDKPPVWRKRPEYEIAGNDDPGYPDMPLVRIHARDNRGPLALRVAIIDKNNEKRKAIWDFDNNGCAFTGYLAGGMKLPLKLYITLLDTAGGETRAARSVRFPSDVSGYLCLVNEASVRSIITH